MNKLVSRLLIFFLGIPLVSALVLFLPQYNHFILHICLIVLNTIATLELRDMLSHKCIVPPFFQTLFFAIFIPLSISLQVAFKIPHTFFTFAVFISLGFLFAKGVFFKNPNRDLLEELATSLILFLYPTFFAIYIIAICALPNASLLLLVFLLSVFANDSAAWFFGMLFGKNNRGLIAVSPNKSLVGFIAGLLTSVLITVLALHFLPQIDFLFPAGKNGLNNSLLPFLFSASLLGLFTGLAAIAGDLIESAIKRSTEVKDSGTLMQGRGGILDSMDSVVFAAPVFYYFFLLLFA